MYEQISSNIWRSRALLVFFIVIVGLLAAAFYYVWDNPIIVPIAIVFAVGSTVGSYYYSDKIVLATAGARPVDNSEFPHYVNSVEGLAIAGGIPVPKTYVIDDPAPTA